MVVPSAAVVTVTLSPVIRVTLREPAAEGGSGAAVPPGGTGPPLLGSAAADADAAPTARAAAMPAATSALARVEIVNTGVPFESGVLFPIRRGRRAGFHLCNEGAV